LIKSGIKLWGNFNLQALGENSSREFWVFLQKCDTQHNDTRPLMLSVVILNVVAPKLECLSLANFPTPM
jgi:hypothetical protein